MPLGQRHQQVTLAYPIREFGWLSPRNPPDNAGTPETLGYIACILRHRIWLFMSTGSEYDKTSVGAPICEPKQRPSLRSSKWQAAMGDAKPTVLVVDDDPALRKSVGRLLRSLAIDAQLFASIADFLNSDPPDGPACLVLDVRLPGKSGLDLQRELAAANRELPIIFITGHGDIPMTVQAMKGGAIDFLTKPFRDQDLLEAIQLGLSHDRVRRENEKALAALRERFASLSPRERDIMIQVARGRLSKQIANDIGIAEGTVKVHRSRAMKKMKARSLPELGRMADKLKLVPEEETKAATSGK
jgi:FixJ family two-component response regulator